MYKKILLFVISVVSIINFIVFSLMHGSPFIMDGDDTMLDSGWLAFTFVSFGFTALMFIVMLFMYLGLLDKNGEKTFK